MPVRERQCDFANDPITDFRNEACPLGDGNKAVGLPQTFPRMIPAQKRLCARDLARDQAHLRLEGENEFVALNGFAKGLFGVDALLMIGRKLRVEEAML